MRALQGLLGLPTPSRLVARAELPSRFGLLDPSGPLVLVGLGLVVSFRLVVWPGLPGGLGLLVSFRLVVWPGLPGGLGLLVPLRPVLSPGLPGRLGPLASVRGVSWLGLPGPPEWTASHRSDRERSGVRRM
ncbi:hypothetical protein Ade02nite_59500 [Paractinoplanes deccanensis]|uniref:Uncharacterized protein n=1 Tax=Paractinoplanes deccanensis TaxID=113561 RepID=A0ABQ3YBE2_9ACTN|nr:hypothetical protein Ade02nite_59500 [Actinoplanes deccanensis]